MIENLIDYLIRHPPGAWIGPILGATALVETLFPPFPGDMLFLALTGWAVAGGAHPAVAAGYGLAGCFAASCVLFLFGSVHGKRLVDGRLARRVDPGRLGRAVGLVARRGPVILLLSRFLPGIRSLIVVVAGGSGMRFRAAVAPILAGAAAWYAALTAGGTLVGDNLEAAEEFMGRFETWVWASLGVVLIASLLVLRGRKRRSGS